MPESITYYAMAVPTFFRNRLRRLPRDTVIGTYTMEGVQPQSFDVLLLSAAQLPSARQYLGHALNVELEHRPSGGPVFNFVPKDIRRLDVPATVADPRAEATARAITAFGLDLQRTVYADALSVTAIQRRTTPSPLRVETAAMMPAQLRHGVITLEQGSSSLTLSPLTAGLLALRGLDPARRRDRLVFNQAPVPSPFRRMSQPNRLQA